MNKQEVERITNELDGLESAKRSEMESLKGTQKVKRAAYIAAQADERNAVVKKYSQKLRDLEKQLKVAIRAS